MEKLVFCQRMASDYMLPTLVTTLNVVPALWPGSSARSHEPALSVGHPAFDAAKIAIQRTSLGETWAATTARMLSVRARANELTFDCHGLPYNAAPEPRILLPHSIININHQDTFETSLRFSINKA